MFNVEILRTDVFTPAENKILVFICQCFSRKEIARATKRSYGTISKQIDSIAEKLNAHSTSEIIVKATSQPNPIVKITFLSLLLMIGLINGDETRNTPRRIRAQTIRYNQQKAA